jgi:tetratricopeptide (TPR) repeat protein
MHITVTELLDKAIDLRNDNDFEGALNTAISVVEIDSESAEAWWQISLNNLSLGDNQSALLSLKKVIDLVPKFSKGLLVYGNTLLEIGDEKNAKHAFEKVIEIDQSNSEALFALAEIYSRQNKDKRETDEKELNILKLLDELNLLSDYQINKIGILYYQKGNYLMSIKYWQKISKGSLLLKDSLFNLGLAYKQPELSQKVDSVDVWRYLLKIYPDQENAVKCLSNILPNLLELAKKNDQNKTTILNRDQWYRFYINPYELINASNLLQFEDFDTKQINKLKKILLHEIELEDGKISWMSQIHIDKSKAISLCDELSDVVKSKFHWLVFNNKSLLHFLGCGEHIHFLVNENSSPLDIIEILKVKDNGFEEWLSEPFSKQFDLVLSNAIDQKNILLLEYFLSGRRWVSLGYVDKCFENSRKQIDKILDPLREFRIASNDKEPTVESISLILEQTDIINILNLLPIHFRDFKNEAPSLIRGIALICYQTHSNAQLSKKILQITHRFDLSVELMHSIEDDFKQIEEIISEECKNEVRLTSNGKKWEILRDGVYHGDNYFPINMIKSLRWGINITSLNSVNTYDFLFAVKNHKGEEIIFSWLESKDIEKSQSFFNKFIDAAMTYLIPSIVQDIDTRLKSGNIIQIGQCSISEGGVQFETKKWMFTNVKFLPWDRVSIKLNNGTLVISDLIEPKISTQMSLRTIDNAPLLQILFFYKTNY